MCFAPHARAIFQTSNFKKRSEPLFFLTFWLENVLRATRACHFSNFQLQKVVWSPQFFNILTWKCASHHTRVQFLTAPLATGLRTRRFSEPTFGSPRHTNHWKNTVFCDFPNIFAHLTLSSFFWLSFLLLFYSSLLSASSYLCFSSLHIVGSLTVKLPSII